MLERNKFGGFRGLVLILVGIFMGATLITPAVAHVGGTINHLWGAPGHIKAKVKAYGDNRWLGKTAKAVDSAHADSADLATSAETASFADEADSATTAESAAFADEAGNADLLAGRNAADFDDANSVDGKSANDIVRVARMVTGATLALTTADQTYGTALSITAPAAGFVLVNSSVTFIESPDCTSGCVGVSRIRHIQSGNLSQFAEEDVATARGSASNTSVFAVSAGVNTFDLRLFRFTGNGTLSGWWGELTALYVPFGSTGAGTLGVVGKAGSKAG